jgi:hypothetical protein
MVAFFSNFQYLGKLGIYMLQLPGMSQKKRSDLSVTRRKGVIVLVTDKSHLCHNYLFLKTCSCDRVLVPKILLKYT